jgi:hypothetical protein
MSVLARKIDTRGAELRAKTDGFLEAAGLDYSA